MFVTERKSHGLQTDRLAVRHTEREREREREIERREIFLLFCCTLLLDISRELLTGLYVLLQKM